MAYGTSVSILKLAREYNPSTSPLRGYVQDK